MSRAQIDAIDTVRDALGVESVHTIGYCVAGTTLAATLAVLAAQGRGRQGQERDLLHRPGRFRECRRPDASSSTTTSSRLVRSLSPDGFLDGRYMALTFNLLRGRDLIWNYVTNNYLLGQDYAPFDLLHWNGDTTNLPAKWHMSYLTDLYRDNLLVKPGALSVDGTPDRSDEGEDTRLCPGRARGSYRAGGERLEASRDHFAGPMKFVLAGSGHIAGVVNPPSLRANINIGLNPKPVETLAEFVAGATETTGSWWPDWLGWLRDQDDRMVHAKGARNPGKGKLKAIADAPGRYVRER